MKNEPRRPDFKQLGLGGSITAAIIFLTPIKNYLFTREEGTALSQQVSELKTFVAASNTETTRVVERKVDKILEAMREQEHRSADYNRDQAQIFAKDQERQDRNIEILMAGRLPKRLGN